MTIVPFLCLLAFGPGPIRPPMHRIWTELSNDYTRVLDVRDGVVTYCSQNKVRALDLHTGKPKWTFAQNRLNTRTATINSKTIYICSFDQKSNQIFAIDRKTGMRSAVKLPGGGYDRELQCDDKRIYVLDITVVRAIDIATKKQAWKVDLRSLAKGKPDMLRGFSAGYGHVFAGISDLGFFCLDAINGKMAWKDFAKYGLYNLPLILPGGVITQFNGTQLRSFKDGSQIWKSKLEQFEPNALDGNVLIGMDAGQPCAIDIRTGKTLWTGPIPKERWTHGGGFSLVTSTEGGGFTYERGEKITMWSKTGQVVWQADPFFDGQPEYVGKDIMLCSDGERLLAYGAGPPPAVPKDEAGQQALAKKLVQDYELLDMTERQALIAVGKYASKALIDKYVQWAMDKMADRQGRGMNYYSLLTETPAVLDKICGPSDSDHLMEAIAKLGPENEYRGSLTEILGRRGDQAKAMPGFIERVKRSRNNNRQSSDVEEALNAIAESKDSQAVKFMIEALDDPKAPGHWRQAAFNHLAGTGGQAGIDALLRARHKPGPRPTWQVQLMDTLDSKDIHGEAKDANGKTWRLVSSYVLGNGGDLFIQAKTNSGWDKPIFTGFSTSRTFLQEAPKTYKGIGVNKLIESEWVKVFPGDPDLTKDSDNDGLTNIVEERLGTDPNKADTDGDALADNVDPCPTAAPRTLGDTEKIVAACVEAHFFSGGYEYTPANISVQGVEPFEMYGYGGTLIWPKEGAKSGLDRSYGAGMNSIGFSPFIDDFRADAKDYTKKPIVRFSDNGMTAETLISRYSGGLNGEGMNVKLKKIGDDWFVVEMRMAYVS